MNVHKKLNIGDAIVLATAGFDMITGIIIAPYSIDGWWEIFTSCGSLLIWPGNEMELIENA
tara:strand:- start:495 stop:677 length:183 start_codon:yes stop_codon:yes gene_type:complete